MKSKKSTFSINTDSPTYTLVETNNHFFDTTGSNLYHTVPK